MKVRIQDKPAFKVAGIKAEEIEASSCPQIWDALFERYTYDELDNLGNGTNYGVCYAPTYLNRINYMAAYDVEDIDKAKKMGLDIMEIEEAKYAVFELRGPVPQCIQEGWKYAVHEYFPKNGLTHSGKPDFEVYLNPEMDMNSDDYEMELWVPIVKKENL